jgi:hypothetical protein
MFGPFLGFRAGCVLFAISSLGYCCNAQVSDSKLSAHLINTYTAGSSNVVSGKPRVWKVLALDSGFPPGMVQAMRDYKARVPDGKVVVRVYSPKNYSLADDPTASALDFWNNIILPPLNGILASDRALIDYLEGPNEGETPTLGYPSRPEGSHWFNQFWTNLTPLIVSGGYKPCIGSIPVGNPPAAADFDPFLPAMRQAKAAGGAWSYHAYTVEYSTDVGVELWYSLRYRQIYTYFAQQGYTDLANMPLILTEGGVDQSGNPSTSGWQYRGTAAQYERWLNWFDRQMAQDSYVLGCTLFQNGDPSGWSSFDLEPICGWLKNYLTNPSTWPSPPSGVSASLSGNTAVIHWTNAPANPCGYAVKRATVTGGPYTLLGSGITEGMPVTGFTDSSPVLGVTNYYVVTAVNAIGESDPSAEVAVGPSLYAALPAAPSGLSAAPAPGNVTLNWSVPTNAASFKIKRSTTSGAGYAVIATNVSAPPFRDTSYTVGTPYYYVVSAVNNLGESADSGQASATPTNALPDVVVTAITWSPATIYPGNNVTFTATVKNRGSAAAPGNGTSMGVGFNVDGVGGFYSGGYAGPLQPGASVNLTANGGTVTWPATAGNHTVTANADDINRFPEGDENNNQLSVPFSTSVSNYTFNCGGGSVGGFVSDAAYTASLCVHSVTNPVTTAGVSNAAPAMVYQSERWRSFTTVLPSLKSNQLYKARLHFAEISPLVTSAGDRQFNVSLNGALVLTNFDILAAAGAKYRALTRQFNVASDAAGKITLLFSRGAAFEPTASGIEIFPYTNTAPVLAAIGTRTVNAGAPLVITNSAADRDLPADTLTFTLTAQPAGAGMTPGGVFSWTAPRTTARITNSATVRVTDNGTPALSDSKSFSIIVVPPPRSLYVTVNSNAVGTLWSVFPAKTYRVYYKDDLNAADWTPLGAAQVAAGDSLSVLDPAPAARQRFYRIAQLD